MMFLKSVVLGAFVAAANADNLRTYHRHLSYDFIAGYRPDSSVTDHNAIDLDQAEIVKHVSGMTQESFNSAKRVYEEGGHSKSYAKLTIEGNLPSLSNGQRYAGETESGNTVYGRVYKSEKSPPNQVWLQYEVSDSQDNYVDCQVGGLSGDAVNTNGCFKPSGTIKLVDGFGEELTYSYDSSVDNDNGRTIKGFSTAVQAKMIDGCPGCPYDDANYFVSYYGDYDYADKWVQAAIAGTTTSFSSGRGDADFSQYQGVGRAEAIKKGTAYMNVFMYVIREFEDALDDCKKDCIKCNDDPVHAWDEGVAFYTGTLEGERGEGKGQLLYALADKRCGDYNTCVDDLNTMSAVNKELFELFAVGQSQLLGSKCDDARVTTARIVDLMYIPLIQGTMRYAHKVGKQGMDGEKEKAEGAVFAASVLPRIYAENKDAAKIIYDNMKVGASSTDYQKVRDAFQSVYGGLNIGCEDVGGLVDSTGAYFAGAEPCSTKSTAKKAGETVGIVIGVVGGLVALAAIGYIFFLRGRERQGKPVFAPTTAESAI